MKSMIVSVAILMSATSAFSMDWQGRRQSDLVEVAQVSTVNETQPTQVSVQPTQSPTVSVDREPSQDLKDQFLAVCASKAVKSKKLASACETHTWPTLNKKGTKFTQANIGKEFLILYANIEFLK